MQDTLSDMLVRIKNAQSTGKKNVIVSGSKLNKNICLVLAEEGFIQEYMDTQIDGKPFLNIMLRYYEGRPVISNIKRISKSSLRKYMKCNEIPTKVDEFGIIIFSTPKGVMSHIKAKQNNLGGEPLVLVN